MLKTKEVLLRLKALRVERELKQGYVAKRLGIDRTTYVRKEKGLIPITTEEWLKLAEALDETPSYFFMKGPPAHGLDVRESAIIGFYKSLSPDEKEKFIGNIICLYEGVCRNEAGRALDDLKRHWS